MGDAARKLRQQENALFKARADRIEAALLRLPTYDDRDLSNDARIRIIAEDLGRFNPVRIFGNHDTQANRGTTKKELARIERLATQLRDAITTAHESTADILGVKYDGLKPDGISSALFTIAWKAANSDLSHISQTPQYGAPPKDDAAQIATRTAEHFIGLTGLLPTIIRSDGRARGPFMSLLDVVFEEHGIMASVEYQAVAASAKMRAQIAHDRAAIENARNQIARNLSGNIGAEKLD